MTNTISERELVMGILLEVTRDGNYSHIALRNVLSKYQYLDKKQRSFITRVTEGTLEHLLEIDYIINQFSKIKVKKMKPVIQAIIRSGVYQLKYMDNVPDSAVCNEAVKLAVKKGLGQLKGFVNGLLRNIARKMDEVHYPDENTVEGMSIRYSMPEWIIRQWETTYDRATVGRMLADFLTEKPTVIRYQSHHMTKEEFLEKMRQEGVVIEEHPYLPYAFYLSGYDYLNALKSFEEGDFQVQDISSMLVTEIAAPKEGDRVMDVCAAPGGKALHMAERVGTTGLVEARDLTPYKVALLEENIQRAGLTNVRVKQQDATIYDQASKEKADILIADLPCSGLGVLGKKTDLKYKMTADMQEELVQLQRKILSTIQEYVKVGGTLLYSTCTIHEEENQGNVQWFLHHYPQYELAPIQDFLCEELKQEVNEDGCLQLLPGTHKSDGFFIAKFRKVQ